MKRWFDVIKDAKNVTQFDYPEKEEAIIYALKNDADLVVLIEEFEPIDVVYQRPEGGIGTFIPEHALLPVVFVGGQYDRKRMYLYQLLDLPEFSGKFTHDSSAYRSLGRVVKRHELDCVPVIEGYTDMWDGNKVRFETWDIYNSMND